QDVQGQHVALEVAVVVVHCTDRQPGGGILDVRGFGPDGQVKRHRHEREGVRVEDRAVALAGVAATVVDGDGRVVRHVLTERFLDGEGADAGAVQGGVGRDHDVAVARDLDDVPGLERAVGGPAVDGDGRVALIVSA